MNGQKMCRFGELVHNHLNGVVVNLDIGQTDNEVHGDVFPLPFRYKQRLKSFDKFLMFCLHLLAYEIRIRDWSSDVCSSDLRL